MEFKGVRVLVPEAGKQALAMIRGLKELGCHVTVMGNSKHSAGIASKLPEKKLLSMIYSLTPCQQKKFF